MHDLVSSLIKVSYFEVGELVAACTIVQVSSSTKRGTLIPPEMAHFQILDNEDEGIKAIVLLTQGNHWTFNALDPGTIDSSLYFHEIEASSSVT